MLASSAAERTGCSSVSVSRFARRVGPVFLSGTSNMLILFGSWSRGVCISSEKNCVVCQQHHQLHADNQVCVDVIISPVSKLPLPTSFGALVQCFRCQAHLKRHAVVNGKTRTSPSVTSKVDNIEHADHVVLLGVLDWAIVAVRRMVWRKSSP